MRIISPSKRPRARSPFAQAASASSTPRSPSRASPASPSAWPPWATPPSQRSSSRTTSSPPLTRYRSRAPLSPLSPSHLTSPLQLVNEAAKFRYRSGGQFNVGGLTVRTPTMSVGHGGLYHSQSPEGFFMGAAGLKVRRARPPAQRALTRCRSSSRAPRSRLKASSWPPYATPTPCSSWSPRSSTAPQVRAPRPSHVPPPPLTLPTPPPRPVEHVPLDDYELPLGRAEVLVPGTDLTLLTWGTPLYHCETALALLARPPAALAPHVPAALRAARVELLDLRTILPWDVETVLTSVRRTGRLVVVHEAAHTGGVGAEIAAEVQRRAFLRLAAPVRRVTGWE